MGTIVKMRGINCIIALLISRCFSKHASICRGIFREATIQKKLTFQDSRVIKNNPSAQTNWAEGLRYSTSVNYDKNQAVTRGVVVVHSETVNS